MLYKVELIKREDLKTNTWSGGITTQLAIYPKDAIYSEQNFKWRLSSAKVQVEESIFTSLPNINRIIMIIKGELILEHEGHHKSVLKPFDQDSFSGSWNTKSYGKVTDFNLMTSDSCQGELESIYIEKGKYITVSLRNDNEMFEKSTQALYCVNGKVKIKTSPNEELNLSEGDIALITLEDNLNLLEFTVCNEGEIKADLIKATIKVN